MIGKFKMILLTLLSLLVFLFNPVFGLYEDQAGKFDWVKRYIGSVEHIVFDQSTSPARKIIVTTSQNVVAALGTKSGEILWRHILEAPEFGKISTMYVKDHFVTVVIGNLLRTWDVITAALKEEVLLDIPFKRSDMLMRLYSFGKMAEEFYSADIGKGNVEITILDSISGNVEDERSISAPWLDNNTKCSTSNEVLVCVDLNGGAIHSLNMAFKNANFVSNPLSSVGIVVPKDDPRPDTADVSKVVGTENHVLIKVGNTKKIVSVHKDGVRPSLDLSESQTGVVEGDWMFSVRQKLNSVTVQATELSSANEAMELGFVVDLPLQSGSVQSIAVQRFARKDGVVGVRALLACSDHSIHFVGNAGIVWSREESLASVLAVEAVDFPVSGLEETFQEAIEAEDATAKMDLGSLDFFTNFLVRVKNQGHHLVSWVQHIFIKSNDDDSVRQSLVRDRFNMHKLLVVVTSSGKILGLDTRSGEIIWSVFIPSLSPFKDQKVFLVTQRTSAHYPSNPQCVVVGRHRGTGNGLLYVFNPLTGEGIEGGGTESGGMVTLSSPLLQASLLPQMDENYIKPILLIDVNFKPLVFPRSGELIVLQSKYSYFVHLALPDSDLLKGFSFKDSSRGKLLLSEVWRTSLGKGVVIEGVYGKRPTERVHSQGRVLADRSVLYKYSNPNLVVVPTFAKDDIYKNILTVHLVDAVTGAILESVVHKRVVKPFHFIHSENWIVYTYYNEKFRRQEVATLELFEGLNQANVTAFSSFGDKAAPPIVEKQAFILPQKVQAVGHTTTEKGITTKFILLALSTGNVLQVSKWFLDPRRPMTPGAPREEGLVPYMPEVPLSPQEMINHNHTLPRVSGIYTAQTGLESTCLVMIFGLDLFYTRVFPSKMFDVLKDDFDHYLIIGALLSLTVAALVTRKLSQRKALKQAWK